MIGKTLGHYQITDKIGEGGMGIVYKARDTHLDRFVAIKVLAAEKVADPDRKRRFVQEAKAASALNHPNIVHVYDIDQSDGTDYIAMEYVDGKTLDQRIGHRGLRLSDALKYGVQIADALAKAHSAGIVHRDLKPTNIMVNEDGVVKVFDFGLAKLTEQIKGDETASTATVDGEGRQITEEGVIVGTVAYMSPEQAEGKKVDARSDIFSLGSVLYEMVTGQKAFHGTSKMSTLSAILHQEPKPVSGITPTIPADLEKLINRCLRKDPQRRWQNMADLKVALDELKEDSDSGRLKAVPARERVSTPVRLLLIAVAVITIVAIGWYWLRRQRRAEPVAPLVVVPLTSYPGEESSPSFSPDGNQVAFSWNGEKEDNFDIYVKLIKSPKPLRLTTDPAWDGNPAFSPDGQSIAFARILNDRVAILLVPAIGGPERLLAEFRPASAVSLSWFPDGKWIATDGIAVISVETGEIRKLTSLPTGSFRDHTPAISPDGRTIVFSRADGVSEIYLLGLTPDLKPKGEPKQLTHLNRQSDQPVWTADGHNIIFTSALAWELNLWRVSLSDSGGPKPLFVGSNKDRSPTISHQGNRLAFTRRVSDRNIYRLSLTEATAKSSQPVRFLQSSRDEFNPKYSPDGTLIAFESDRTGSRGIWVSDAEGSNLVEVFGRGGSPRWSPDGQRLVFDSDVGGTAAIYVVRASGGKPVRLTYGPQASTTGSWSHDGNWIYFCSERDGQDQIWKIPAEGGDAVQVTGDGGFWPVESPDGKSLYFMRWSGDGNNKLWKIPVSGGVGSQILPSFFLCNYELMDDGIYFIRRPDKSGKAQLQFLSFAANAARTITTLPGQITFGLAVSPDRRYLLYSTDDLSGSDLMLVENFR